MPDLSGVCSISDRPVSPDWVVLGDHWYLARTLAVGTWLASGEASSSESTARLGIR